MLTWEWRRGINCHTNLLTLAFQVFEFEKTGALGIGRILTGLYDLV